MLQYNFLHNLALFRVKNANLVGKIFKKSRHRSQFLLRKDSWQISKVFFLNKDLQLRKLQVSDILKTTRDNSFLVLKRQKISERRRGWLF
jgi:DNA-binding transcriptional regulator GbsR (MarR family)